MLWKKNEDLNGTIEDLFQPIENVFKISSNTVLDYHTLHDLNIQLSIKSKIKRTFCLLNIGKYHYFNDKKIKPDHYHDVAFWMKISGKILMNTCLDFYSPEFENPELFKPIEELQERIDEEIAKFEKPTIGLHIRRTDNHKSIENSPIELFIQRIYQLLDSVNDFNFYLATDDVHEEKLLKSKFGKRIIVQENKNFLRNSKEGIQHALIDLYTLSRTKFIIGSYWSSFSITAAGLHRIPLEVIKKKCD